MASLSLPRVLQNRKTTLEVERENFEKSQAVSISKAINVQETPVKEKHVRSAIIGTYQEKGANTFWMVVLKLPLQDNRIVAWKFCHVLHKVLREGHPHAMAHSQRHRAMIQDLGKLWMTNQVKFALRRDRFLQDDHVRALCHLQEGYGKLIQHYTHLLVTKLEFHRRNPRFPGNLNVTHDQLERIGENDINNYFEMSIEMLDYLDEILTLQSAIFGSLDMSRSNSMMSSGQCRLAPLIPCIQDSSRLYDLCVKILFKLHASLPPDTLLGHRERFLKQFRTLRDFYINASNLQYFKTLIQVPLLPDSPPNFLIEADLRTYVTPVVVMSQEEPDVPDAADAFLVDTTDSMDGHSSPEQSIKSDPAFEQLLQENQQLRRRLQRLLEEHQRIVDELNDQKAALEMDLATRDSELLQERQLKEDLLKHTEEASKYHEYEKQAQIKDEKFQKLKEVYGKLREEHIALLRSKAEVDKQFAQARLAVDTASRLRGEIDQLLEERAKAEETETQLTTLRTEKEHTEADRQALSAKLEWLTREKTELESDLQDLLAQKQSLDVRLQSTLLEHQQKLTTCRSQLLHIAATEAESLINVAIEEMDNPALSASTSSPDYLRGLAEPVRSALTRVTSLSGDAEQTDSLAVASVALASTVANFLLHCRTTGNSSPDIELGEKLAESGKEAGKTALTVVGLLRTPDAVTMATAEAGLLAKLEAVFAALERLTGALKGDSSEVIADLVENELADMEKAIEEAAKKIEELSRASREKDSGVKLEVNEKILESCTGLMAAIRVLVQKARLLQAEVVAQGKGSASAKEFYKRNHRWTEGLISAAKAVASGATFLLSCADKVVRGEAKFEPLIVASQEIAASTAQLVVASRVKADRSSNNLSQLGTASRAVTQATAAVVAAAKSCSQLVEDSEVLDVSKLSLHQAKRLEMESQVRVLELEASLQQERVKLSALRRHHYQLAGDAEGWEIVKDD